MKPISIHVSTRAYAAFRDLANRAGRPTAELIREAMADYLRDQPTGGRSVLNVPPHASGRLRRRWTREQLLDEMRR